MLVLNQSTATGDVCLYQTVATAPLGAVPVAWLTRRATPRTRLTFQWMTDYAFVWSSSAATLEPGALITASQVWPADLTSTNQITLTYGGGTFTFANQTAGSAGSLVMVQVSTIPARLGVAGIGMADQTTTIVPMQPNVTLRFDPRPRYWIAFGSFTAGEVIDVESAGATEIVFPANVTSMSALLGADNIWTIAPTASANRRMAAASRHAL
ncbi:MAG TPA: hypothetical protein VF846_15060 [Thermoanaerobaculia bacterium]